MSGFSINVEPLELRRLMSVGLASGGGGASVGPMPATIVPLTTATPKPTNGGVTLTEEAGQSFTAKLGEFSFRTVDQLLDADISWGDGSHSPGKLVGSYATGEYYVVGTHTYAATGTYSVDVQIHAHLAGSPTTAHFLVAQFTSVIKTAPVQPTNGGETLTETATRKFTARLGEFTYKTVDQFLNAVIYWGDGTKSVGTLDGSYATGKYYVEGTHTYAHTGTYKVQVKIFARPAGSPFQPTSPVAQFISVIKVMGNA